MKFCGDPVLDNILCFILLCSSGTGQQISGTGKKSVFIWYWEKICIHPVLRYWEKVCVHPVLGKNLRSSGTVGEALCSSGTKGEGLCYSGTGKKENLRSSGTKVIRYW
jgi:hypothetical protein